MKFRQFQGQSGRIVEEEVADRKRSKTKLPIDSLILFNLVLADLEEVLGRVNREG